jgi:hypothetical protein
MTLTEDEAKTKWCPFARVALRNKEGAVSTAFNRQENSKNEASAVGLCIGSACMAWRGLKADDAGGYVGRGFCGLAGKP